MLSCLGRSSVNKFTNSFELPTIRDFTNYYTLEAFYYFLQKDRSFYTLEFLNELKAFKDLKIEEEKIAMVKELYKKYLNEDPFKECPPTVNIRESLCLLNGIQSQDLYDQYLKVLMSKFLVEPWLDFHLLTYDEVKHLVAIGRIKKYKLDDIFVNEHLYYIFKKFLKEEYAEEILLFYEETQRFKRIESNTARYEVVLNVFTKFIQLDGPYEVNIKSETREKMKNVIKNKINQKCCPREIFDDIFVELKQSSLLESWSRFQNTKEYQKLFD